MNINVQINLTEGETVPTATPAEVLTMLGGDPSKDSIGVSISAGHAPPPPQPLIPEVQPMPPLTPEVQPT
jgi:hypothetical protein